MLYKVEILNKSETKVKNRDLYLTKKIKSCWHNTNSFQKKISNIFILNNHQNNLILYPLNGFCRNPLHYVWLLDK